MDQILTCTRCPHTIGEHSADGCARRSSTRLKCQCIFTPFDIVEDTLHVDDLRRSLVLTRSWAEESSRRESIIPSPHAP